MELTQEQFQTDFQPITTGFNEGFIYDSSVPAQILKALSFDNTNIWTVIGNEAVPYSGMRYGDGLIVTIIPHNYKDYKIILNDE